MTVNGLPPGSDLTHEPYIVQVPLSRNHLAGTQARVLQLLDLFNIRYSKDTWSRLTRELCLDGAIDDKVLRSEAGKLDSRLTNNERYPAYDGNVCDDDTITNDWEVSQNYGHNREKERWQLSLSERSCF